MQQVCQTIQEFLTAHGIPDWLVVFIISLCPILECRLGMFTAIVLLQMNPFVGFIISFLGNILPIPFILLLINWIFELLKISSLIVFLNSILSLCSFCGLSSAIVFSVKYRRKKSFNSIFLCVISVEQALSSFL